MAKTNILTCKILIYVVKCQKMCVLIVKNGISSMLCPLFCSEGGIGRYSLIPCKIRKIPTNYMR